MSIEKIVQALINNKLALIALVLVISALANMGLRSIIAEMVHEFMKRHKQANKQGNAKREQTLSSIFKTFISVLIWLIAITICLSIIGIDVAALLAGAGVIGVIVGLGAQNTIKDVLAGIFIIIENQFRIGDVVTINVSGTKVSGVVEEISVRITKLRDLDGNLHIIKNGSAEVITNRTFHFANVNIDLDVAYDSDIDLVEKVINQVGKGMVKSGSTFKDSIYEPIKFVRVASFEMSSVRVKTLGKVEPAKQWDVSGEFLRRIKKAFHENKIEIPFSQVVVHQAKK